jgi:hypothetical protein
MKKYALGALALTLSAGLVGTALPAQADPIPAGPGSDPAPAAAAAAYLAAQPGEDDLIKTFYIFPEDTPPQSYTDHGITIDAAWALDAVGGQSAAVTAMTAALEAGIGDYAFGGGSKAKISAYLLSQGVTSTAVTDVIADIETNHISTTGLTTGRLQDDTDDFNTPLTQAYAVSALTDAESDLADEALAFLLDQQCADGFIRGSFAAKGAQDQTCDGASPAATGNVDTTGLVLLMLADLTGDITVAEAAEAALDWLAFEQDDDGSFNGGNANSTGLAGWALGRYGYTEEAAEAAAWVRAHQLANAGSCTPFAAADNGAITLDDLGYANAQAGPFDAVDNSGATRATAQALPALLWAEGGVAAGESTVSATTDFVKAGTEETIDINGAPGNSVCVSLRGTNTLVVLDEDGDATPSVTLPGRTLTSTITVTDAGGELDTVAITGLAKKKVPFQVAAAVRKGKKVAVRIKGLEAGESILVKFRGEKVTKTQANAAGEKTVRFRATGPLGSAKILVRGQFSTRRNSKAIRVLR